MNYSDKRVLLIGGNGTLGTYVCAELRKLGVAVDIADLDITPRAEGFANDPHITYHKARATVEELSALFAKQRYDGIVNFMHYVTVDEYRPIHKLLVANTDHLIFLSSYRIYANEQVPITEDAPRLLEIIDDPDFLANENYALPKARCEDFMKSEDPNGHWTAVRPVISSSQKRFDIFTHSDHAVIECAKAGIPMPLPECAKTLTAGIDWAGNSGKLIAHLLFKPATYGQAYNISTGQNLTWEQIANIYTELLGAKFVWVPTEEFMNDPENNKKHNPWAVIYDRMFDRKMDVTKVMAATGLTQKDFTSIKDGIAIELAQVLD